MRLGSAVVFVAVSVLGLVLVLPSAVLAAPPPLTGTTLLGGPATDVDRDCNPSGTSTVTFEASGTAIGTYAGTYTESGTITIGPQTTPIFPLFGLSFAGAAATIETSFTITSAVGDVTGSKTLAVAGPFNQLCGSFSGQSGPQFGGLTDASGEASQAGGNVTYDALIDAPDGMFSDSGAAFLNTVSVDASDGVGGTYVQNSFFESFGASNGVVPAPAGTVKPGKGCGDKNAEHEREDECKKPPK